MYFVIDLKKHIFPIEIRYRDQWFDNDMRDSIVEYAGSIDFNIEHKPNTNKTKRKTMLNSVNGIQFTMRSNVFQLNAALAM